MFGKKMEIKTCPQALKVLWERGFFSEERTLEKIREELKKIGYNPSDQNLCMRLKAEYLTRKGHRRNFSYIQKNPPESISLNEDVFPENLIRDLGDDFKTEIDDLKLNYGKSGNCTAFLLRKILEKLIYLAFAKHDFSDKLKDERDGLVGLDKMLGLAQNNKASGTPFLTQKTAKKIVGIKFLGDTSAHNPLVNVDMETILPQMPFIIIAFKELSKKLK